MLEKVKKLVTNKKFLIGAIVVAIGITTLLASLTGAWWFITPDSNDIPSSNFQMGELKVNVSLVNANPNIIYQPGQRALCGIVIENTGNIDAFVKLDFDGVIATDTSNLSDVQQNVKVTVDSDTLAEIEAAWSDDDFAAIADYILVYSSLSDGSAVVLKDPASGNFYLNIRANTTVLLSEDLTVVDFIGGDYDDVMYRDNNIGMKNEYFNDIISIALNWSATQVDPRAVLAEMGVNYGDLEVVCVVTP